MEQYENVNTKSTQALVYFLLVYTFYTVRQKQRYENIFYDILVED